MSLIDKIQRSVRLLRSSVAVIQAQPKLLLFPLMIAVFTTAIAFFFLVPIIFVPTGYHLTQGQHWQALAHKLFVAHPGPDHGDTFTVGPWLGAYLLALYLISMFCATFCNVAFYTEVMAALNGRAVSFGHGFAVAQSRVKSILVWSLFAGLVGVLIRQLEDRLSFVGRFIVGLIGTVWSVASVFAIPVLVREEPTANPVKILGHSAGTIKRAWGELLTGFVGLQGANALVIWMTVVLAVVSLAAAFAISNFWILIPIGATWVLGLVVYSYVAGVASQVYLCALYIYASEGVVPEPYSQELMDMAWKVKKP